MQWVCHNGAFLPAEQPLLLTSNRSFKYGDGLFETARFYQNRLLLAQYHFDRLFSGLQLLNMVPQVTAAQLLEFITQLCAKNNCSALARVRIAAYREENNSASFVMEAMPMDEEKLHWNEIGWRLVVYPFARKSCDVFANLKSANYLPYLMAGQYAKEQGVEESLVLNMYNHICDGSRTNIFYINGTDVYTPPLAEGCVAGVMRRAVINFLKNSGFAVHQNAVTEDELLDADQVFVTNAIEGLRWVQQLRERRYEYGVLKKLHHNLTEFIHQA